MKTEARKLSGLKLLVIIVATIALRQILNDWACFKDGLRGNPCKHEQHAK